MVKDIRPAKQPKLLLHDLIGALSYWGTTTRILLISFVLCVLAVAHIIDSSSADYIMPLIYAIGCLFLLDAGYVTIARSLPFRSPVVDRSILWLLLVGATTIAVVPYVVILSTEVFHQLNTWLFAIVFFLLSVRLVLGLIQTPVKKMSIICPTVMPQTDDPHVYREQVERVAGLSPRIQIDLMDGVFAPNKNLNPIQLWWPEGNLADIHFMYQKPADHLTTLVSLRPNMIILHYESEGDLISMIDHIKQFGIKAGVAILQSTQPEDARSVIEAADHVLIFAGQLGEPGQANLEMLIKVEQIKKINQKAEIGWDGGANQVTVKQLSEAGIDVINVGSAIQRAEDPVHAYSELQALIN